MSPHFSKPLQEHRTESDGERHIHRNRRRFRRSRGPRSQAAAGLSRNARCPRGAAAGPDHGCRQRGLMTATDFTLALLSLLIAYGGSYLGEYLLDRYGR
jgi:hypothetical protein